MQRREFVRMTGGLTALWAFPGVCLAEEKRMKNALAHPEMYEQAPSEVVPGIWQTFVGSIACLQKTMGREVDPAWLMGATGFAFRAIAQIAGLMNRGFTMPASMFFFASIPAASSAMGIMSPSAQICTAWPDLRTSAFPISSVSVFSGTGVPGPVPRG